MPDTAELVHKTNMGIATVMARKNADLAEIARILGVVAMPSGSVVQAASGEAVIGTGPTMWMVTKPDAAPEWADGLAGRLAGLASVSDQTGGYALYSLHGPNARALLQKGAFIDLHPDIFGPGSAATTVIAHVGVIMWQTDEQPTFNLALFRSFRSSFEHWFAVVRAATAAVT